MSLSQNRGTPGDPPNLWLAFGFPLLAIAARDAGNEKWNDPEINYPTGGFQQLGWGLRFDYGEIKVGLGWVEWVWGWFKSHRHLREAQKLPKATRAPSIPLRGLVGVPSKQFQLGKSV